MATIMINNTDEPWNNRDKQSLKRAKYVCRVEYGPRGAPCLKRFIKREPLTYWAICGGNDGNQEFRVRVDFVEAEGS